MNSVLCEVEPRTLFGDIRGVMGHVFPGIQSVVCVDVLQNCFPCTCALLKSQYGFLTPMRTKIRRQRLWDRESWAMVENIGQPQLYDRESQLAECAHALCYAGLLAEEALGDSVETEALRSACNMLHRGVPIGRLPKRPYPLVVYLF